MKIGVISEWYDPEIGSPALVGAVTRALAALGNDVRVLTGFPNYPSGELYDGYRLRLMMQEEMRGIPVRRVWLYPSHDSSFARRCLTYLTFAASTTLWGIWHMRKVDVLLVFCSPVTVGIPGVALRRLGRVPLVLFVQDIWPESVLASGMAGAVQRGPLRRALQRASDAIYKSADRVAVITPGARDALAARGVASETIDVIYNWVDESLYRPQHTQQIAHSPFVLMYAGSIGHVQGLDVAIRALAALSDAPDVSLHFVGDGVALPGLRELARQLQVEHRVQFHGSVSQARAAALMTRSQVQLVSLRDLPVFRYTLPSKVQAAMASGLPIVGMVAGDAAELIRRAGAGLVSPPGDVDALAHAFREVSRMSAAELVELGRRARAYYQLELCQDVGVRRLVESLDRAQSARSRMGASV